MTVFIPETTRNQITDIALVMVKNKVNVFMKKILAQKKGHVKIQSQKHADSLFMHMLTLQTQMAGEVMVETEVFSHSMMYFLVQHFMCVKMTRSKLHW